jgi:hypothetical protein
MNGPTANKTIQTTITTITNASQGDNRRDLSYLPSLPQERDEVIAASDSSADDGASSIAKSITLSTTSSQLDGVIDSIT